LTSFIAFSNSCRGTRSTTSPYISMKRRRQSFANRSPKSAARPFTVRDVRPRFRIVSIIPGMDERAPERTETRSGLLGRRQSACRRRARGARAPDIDLGADAVEARAAGDVGAHRRLDRKSGRHRDAQGRHLREARALAAESLLAEARALGDTVTE
jgi:hypothetical protein